MDFAGFDLLPFGATTSEINVFGGTFSDTSFDHQAGVLNIFDPDQSLLLRVENGATANFFDSNFSDVQAADISTVNIEDGSFVFVSARNNAVLNFSGGTAFGIGVIGGGTVNVAGGSFDFALLDSDDQAGALNIFGTDFTLDGTPLTGLDLGTAFEITSRDVTLAGILEDGSAFSIDLNSEDLGSSTDFISPNGTLNVILVPTPGAAGVLVIAGVAAARRRR